MSELRRLRKLLEDAWEAGSTLGRYEGGLPIRPEPVEFDEWFDNLDVGKILTAITEFPQPPLPERPVIDLDVGKTFLGRCGDGPEREFTTRSMTYQNGRIEVEVQDVESYKRDNTYTAPW